MSKEELMKLSDDELVKKLDMTATIKHVEAMDRIVDALESISSSLSEMEVSLENIEQSLNSVVAVNGNSSFLCVTGNISSY